MTIVVQAQLSAPQTQHSSLCFSPRVVTGSAALWAGSSGFVGQILSTRHMLPAPALKHDMLIKIINFFFKIIMENCYLLLTNLEKIRFGKYSTL